MARKYVWPKGHWSWPFKVTHKHGLRDGEMIFVGGQVDVDDKGTVRHPGDLAAQTRVAMDHIETVLKELEADLEDVTKLVMFYVNRGDVDELKALATVRERFKGPTPPAIMPVQLPTLAYPGMMVEIEAIAMRGADGKRLARTAFNPSQRPDWPFSHGLRCGEMIWVGCQEPRDVAGRVRSPGDPVAQAKLNIENVRGVLAGFGAELDDVCRINTFYVGHGTAKDWAEAGRIRGNAFKWPGPVGTGVPVPALYPQGLALRQEAVAMLGIDGKKPPRRALRPEGHWDWPIPVNFQQGVKVGRMIFVGGQVACEGKAVVLHPDDLVAQTRVTMDYIRTVLAAFGAKLDDVVKVNTFYKGGASYERLQKNLEIRSSCFSDPGPTTTGIPLVNLGIEHMEIEVEAYAMVG